MDEKDILLETCVLAGKIMLENGGEMYRVEDTMNRIAANYHQEEGISFVTPTVVLMGLESTKNVQMKRINSRTTNLGKVAKVNDYSRKFGQQEIDLLQLREALRILDKDCTNRKAWQKVLSAGMLSGSLMILLGGIWSDFIQTCLVGAVGYFFYLMTAKYLKLKFIDDFIGSFVLGILALFLVKNQQATLLNQIIIGSVMPLVPGVALTNTVRDLQEGHIMAGISRGVEALITASMIGAGIAAAFAIMQ